MKKWWYGASDLLLWADWNANKWRRDEEDVWWNQKVGTHIRHHTKQLRNKCNSPRKTHALKKSQSKASTLQRGLVLFLNKVSRFFFLVSICQTANCCTITMTVKTDFFSTQWINEGQWGLRSASPRCCQKEALGSRTPRWRWRCWPGGQLSSLPPSWCPPAEWADSPPAAWSGTSRCCGGEGSHCDPCHGPPPPRSHHSDSPEQLWRCGSSWTRGNIVADNLRLTSDIKNMLSHVTRWLWIMWVLIPVFTPSFTSVPYLCI